MRVTPKTQRKLRKKTGCKIKTRVSFSATVEIGPKLANRVIPKYTVLAAMLCDMKKGTKILNLVYVSCTLYRHNNYVVSNVSKNF